MNRIPRLAWLTAACAAVSAAAAPTPTPRERLDDVAKRLAAREGITLLVDPEIRPLRSPTVPRARGIERGLDELCSRLPGAAWRRVYTPPAARERLTAGRLAGVVRQMGRVEPAALQVRALAEGREVRFRRAPATELPRSLAEAKLKAEPVYVLFSTTAVGDGASAGDRLRSLQAQQMALGGSEEHEGVSMLRIFQALRSVPKDRLETALAGIHAAGMRSWESTPPEQRQQMLRDSLPVVQRLMDRPGGAQPPARAAPVDHTAELQRVLRALSERFRVPCRSEPGLLVPQRPAAPPSETPTEALEALRSSLPGSGWREVSLPEADRKRLGRPGALTHLAHCVRFLEGLEWEGLVVEDPGAGLASVRILPARDAGAQAAPDPSLRKLFLFYSLTPAAPAGSRDERLARLVEGQFELLGRMSTPELTEAMEGLVRQYDGADEGSRRRMLGLPLTAMLLGTWFPRDAKERGTEGRR